MVQDSKIVINTTQIKQFCCSNAAKRNKKTIPYLENGIYLDKYLVKITRLYYYP